MLHQKKPGNGNERRETPYIGGLLANPFNLNINRDVMVLYILLKFPIWSLKFQRKFKTFSVTCMGNFKTLEDYYINLVRHWTAPTWKVYKCPSTSTLCILLMISTSIIIQVALHDPTNIFLRILLFFIQYFQQPYTNFFLPLKLSSNISISNQHIRYTNIMALKKF